MVKEQHSNVSNALVVFEQAASAPRTRQLDEWWLWLTTEFLGLSAIHLFAVQKVLDQGRWRTAKNPKAYVKTSAKREFPRTELGTELKDETLRIPSLVDEEGHVLTHDAYIDYLSFEGPVKEGGVWRGGLEDYYDPDDYDEDGTWLTPRERLLQRVPGELKKSETLSPENLKLLGTYAPQLIPVDPLISIDWAQIAAKAALDRGERYVLLLRMRGISRERAIAKWKSDKKQKWVAAAWRDFSRNGLVRLRAVLEGAKKS